ncbi:hypothetical protein [Pedobacter sp. Leaf176]|uniref:hypothetical protein n=1 Tax=Pedobacter sp. Leaf176 TaxID=1736286 RepID=UPI0006F49770|nr:hypothetical protein [Pedobacter sp. Leaf176]KQR67253.1 hypothetical protein ASF92_16215 [Pedobacter sp. Leaf176]
MFHKLVLKYMITNSVTLHSVGLIDYNKIDDIEALLSETKKIIDAITELVLCHAWNSNYFRGRAS